MFDLLIENAQLVLDEGVRRGAIGIEDGAIAAILAPGAEASSRARLDLAQRLIFPGLIDAHVHFREPGMAHKEGFANGTRAAAAGGVTSVLVMPTDIPLTLTPESFARKRTLAENNCFVDFGLHAALALDVSHVRALADLGATSFEIFLADADPELRTDSGPALLDALEAVRDIRWTAGVTPGDRQVVESRIRSLRNRQGLTMRDYARAYPPAIEAMGVAWAAAAACELHSLTVFRQISCASSVRMLRSLKRIRRELHAEVNPHYLFLTGDAVDTFGQFAMMTPPLRSAADVSALWEGLQDGTIDFLSTDHAPHLPQEKMQATEDVWKTPMGIPGLQTMLPLVLQAVKERRCTYADIARWCAKTPARLFGLAPRKGGIAVGADADLVVVDPARSEPISDRAQQSRAVHTPFSGRAAGGSIDLVYLRGELIFEDGRIVGPPRGEFLHRPQ